MKALVRIVALVAVLVVTVAAGTSVAPLSANPSSGKVGVTIEISGDGFSTDWQRRYVVRAAYPAGNQNFTHIAWHTDLSVDEFGQLTFDWIAGDYWELPGTWSITVWDQSGRKPKLVSSRLDVLVTPIPAP